MCFFCSPSGTARCELLGKQQILSTTQKVTVSSSGHCWSVSLLLFTGMSLALLHTDSFAETLTVNPILCFLKWACAKKGSCQWKLWKMYLWVAQCTCVNFLLNVSFPVGEHDLKLVQLDSAVFISFYILAAISNEPCLWLSSSFRCVILLNWLALLVNCLFDGPVWSMFNWQKEEVLCYSSISLILHLCHYKQEEDTAPLKCECASCHNIK